MTIEDINRHIKILNEEFLEGCNESFEKFDNGVIYTTSAYDVKNLLPEDYVPGNPFKDEK